MHRAHENGWVLRYPFSDYHVQKEETEKGFLTKDELNALMNNPRLTPRRAYIRDLFIFCCFTGLAHADLKNLKNENIVKNPADGSWWIHTHRQKTGVAENVSSRSTKDFARTGMSSTSRNMTAAANASDSSPNCAASRSI